jgi:hypothetical protein
MKPECNGKIIFNHVEEYLILKVGDPAGRAKMEALQFGRLLAGLNVSVVCCQVEASATG